MKKLLSYIAVVLLYSFTMSSCSKENLEGEPKTAELANIELMISIPTIEQIPYSRKSFTEPDYKEPGNDYENTICQFKGEYDLIIRVFNQNGKTYLGSVYDMEVIASGSIYKTIKGKLPQEARGKDIKLVILANYKSRYPSIVENSPGTRTYSEWIANLQFSYGENIWSSQDAHYLPMVGECNLFINENAAIKNYATVELTRIIAKVYIQIESDHNLTSLDTEGMQDRIYYLPLKDHSPATTSNQLSVNGNDYLGVIDAEKKTAEFYIPEQKIENQFSFTTNTFKPVINIQLTDKQRNVSQHTIEFKNYTTNEYYPVERNHIYRYFITKTGSDIDIYTSIMDWIPKDINSDYE